MTGHSEDGMDRAEWHRLIQYGKTPFGYLAVLYLIQVKDYELQDIYEPLNL